MLSCTCGQRHVAGYGYDDEPTSDWFDLWVCAHCGKPAPMYLERLLADLGFAELAEENSRGTGQDLSTVS